MSASPHAPLLSWLDTHRDQAVQFLQDFTRIDTSNPPGDTRAGAAFISQALEAAGIRVKTIPPRPTGPTWSPLSKATPLDRISC
jgi:hypothetical protein